jgi:hypothetical protein
MTTSLAALLRARDRDALAGFFDARAGYVHAYCASICPPDDVDAATLAAFVEFLTRAPGAGSDDDLDLLLVKATRSSAAGRVEVRSSAPVCRAMPEVLAARANGEHIRSEQAFAAHLDDCATCRETATRLLGAEQSLKGEPRGGPAADVKETWLEIAAVAEEA